MNRVVAGGAALVLLVAGVLMIWRPWQDDLPDDAALRVGEQIVTVDALDARNDSLRALYGIQEPSDEKGRDGFRRQAAKSMAIGIVLEKAVEEEGVEVADKEVDRALADFVAAQFGDDREAFLDSLGNVNTSETAVRNEIRRQLELRLLLEVIAGDVTVSKEELRAAFEERRAQLDLPERRDVNNIVVSERREAKQLRSELDGGARVAELARARSIDGATRDLGGALGPVSRSDLVPAVAKVVFSTAAGGAYGPVQGPQGWNIGVVAEVLPPRKATFAGVRSELRKTLAAEKAQAAWSGWLSARLSKADIEYADSYRPDDPDAVTTWQEYDGQGTGADR